MEKRLKDKMQTELTVLKYRMDGLEVHDKNQAPDLVNTEELKTHLAEMRAEIAKLAKRPYTMPHMAVPESLMSLFIEPPTTQVLDDFWGEVPNGKSGKRKHKAGESNEYQPINLSKEERIQHKKPRKKSRRKLGKKQHLSSSSEMHCLLVLLAVQYQLLVLPVQLTQCKFLRVHPLIRVSTLLRQLVPSAP